MNVDYKHAILKKKKKKQKNADIVAPREININEI